MEPLSSSPLPGRHKRKDPDDYVLDLLSNVTLSSPSPKRLRQDNGLPTIYEEGPTFVAPADCFVDVEIPVSEITELPIAVPEPQSFTPSDERAIVLYKPVNPPLFPGGPVAGSSDLPIKVNARFLSRSNGMLNLFPASQQYGELPFLCSSNDMLAEEENVQCVKPQDNRLAVIPWVPPQTMKASATGFEVPTSQIRVAGQNGGNYSTSDIDQMTIEEAGSPEAMDEDNVLGQNNTDEDNNPDEDNDPVPTFGAEPWQHYGVPQSPYTPVMWSH